MPAPPRPSGHRQQARPAPTPDGWRWPGVLGRDAFEQQLHQEWERACRQRDPLALLLIDIDHFGRYVQGRAAPEVEDSLAQVAATLRRAVFRPGDLVGQYGDDEFAILLPRVHEAGARVVAARARLLVNGLGLAHPGGEGGILTVSVGLAALAPASDKRPQRLVELSRDALHQAKQMGRDSIVSQDWMA